MIFIGEPTILECDEKTRLICNIDEDGISKEIYFEVDKQYGKYLCYERCDAFVVGYLKYAMLFNHDIKSETPISEELLYKINEYLIPALVKNDPKLYNIKIIAPIAPSLNNAGAVGTGLSCGVDSFHALLNNTNSKYKNFNVTHLCLFNVGGFRTFKKYGTEQTIKTIYTKAEKIANELGLQFVRTDSNFYLPTIRYGLNHTYSHSFAVLCLQKLFKTYFYASSGHRIEKFSLENNSYADPSVYELLSLNCFSNGNITFYSEGMAKTRFEKTKFIIDNELVQNNLHVCVKKDTNCNVCFKCVRTLLTIDALGKLDRYNKVFDIDYYRKHKIFYYKRLYWLHLMKSDLITETYEKMKDKLPFYIKLIVFLNFYSILGYDIIEREQKRNKLRIKLLGIKITI